MRHIAALSLFIAAMAAAQPPPGYYDPAQGLSGASLREALHGIISPHQVQTNASLWQHFESTDAHPEGHVWDIYSDVPGGTPAYTFTFVADQCGTYSSEGECYNREHTMPQSWYGSAAPMSTDLHHMYPVDAWVNQQRGNWPYGTVSSPNWTSTNGGKRGPCTWPGCSGTVFEPIDAYKGDLARAYFYMMTRYLPNVPFWTSDMFAAGDLSAWAGPMLYAWHLTDPVDDKERDRNNAVFAIQGNRNPYVDEPQWADAIWGPNAGMDTYHADRLDVRLHDGMLRICREGNLRDAYEVRDGLGRLVQQGTLEGACTTAPFHGAPGMHMVVVRGTDALQVGRFVH